MPSGVGSCEPACFCAANRGMHGCTSSIQQILFVENAIKTKSTLVPGDVQLWRQAWRMWMLDIGSHSNAQQ
jgi:hypothetical protein